MGSIEIIDGRDMLFGDNQHVRRCLRVNIPECQHLVILVNLIWRDLARYHFAEKTVAQNYSPRFNITLAQGSGECVDEPCHNPTMEKQQHRAGPGDGLVVVGLSNRLLSGANLGVPPGQCVTLSGPSGSGKSQLLRSIADLDPHDGEVYINGEESRQISAPKWRRRVMLVPAESQWWYETVGEHFPKDANVDFEALGFDSEVVNWQVERLSTGEKQRLGVLRALSLKPDALLLDEPTSGLDNENRLAVEKLISRYSREHGTPVVWVSHDRDQCERISSRHMVISSGHLVEQG
jgi:ABC-type iron transport system FetAB ATPase subunit